MIIMDGSFGAGIVHQKDGFLRFFCGGGGERFNARMDRIGSNQRNGREEGPIASERGRDNWKEGGGGGRRTRSDPYVTFRSNPIRSDLSKKTQRRKLGRRIGRNLG